MRSSFYLTVGRDEWALVEAYLPAYPGLKLLGVNHFTLGGRLYTDLFFTASQETDLYQLGCQVGRDLENRAGQQRGPLVLPLPGTLGTAQAGAGPTVPTE